MLAIKMGCTVLIMHLILYIHSFYLLHCAINDIAAHVVGIVTDYVQQYSHFQMQF